MAIKISQGFKVTGEQTSIDSRFVLKKSDMVTTLDPDSDLSFYLPDPYFAVCKDDDKFYVYSRNYEPSETTGYFKELKTSSGSGARVWQGTRKTGETDAEAIARIVGGETPTTGDILILKTLMAEDKFSYTAFVYMENKWQAMDGNYDANNVYFRNNIIGAGDYTQVGNITKTKTGTVTIDAAGKSVAELFNKIFTNEINPTITQPSVSCSLTNAGSYEVGTDIAPKYTTTLNPGSYSFGPTPTGVVAEAYKVTGTDGQIKNTASGTFTSIKVAADTNYKITAEIDYSNGAIPLTNLGNNYPEGQIKAGKNSSVSTQAITGYRAYFFGCTNNQVDVINNELIRSLNKSSEAISVGTEFEMNIAQDSQRVIIAFPKNSGCTLARVEDKNGMRADISGRFEKQEVVVYGENFYSAITYNVYVYSPATTLNADVYKVIIG